ncbi:MAG: hypothetical protein V4641_05775 [Pseudomonadota bacterium]
MSGHVDVLAVLDHIADCDYIPVSAADLNETRDVQASVLLFGVAHAWLTYDMATDELKAGLLCAACCILIWLILWFFVRQEIRERQPKRPVYSAELWKGGPPEQFPKDLLRPNELDTYHDSVRKAVRDLVRNRRRNRDAQVNDLIRRIHDSPETVRFELNPTLKP